MSDIVFSESYIDDVLRPISRSSKLPNAIVFSKDEENGDVFITIKDTLGGSKICVRTNSENVSFEDDALRVKDVQKLLSYMEMNGYGKSETAKLTRIDRKTIRNSTYPCIESSGNVGTFTVPLGVDTMFEDYNYNASSEYDAPQQANTVRLLSFILDYQFISTLNKIGSELGVDKIVLSPTQTELKLFLKGSGDNQFACSIPRESMQVYSVDSDGKEISYLDEPGRESYLPFSFTIINHMCMFGYDGAFRLMRHEKSGIYGLSAFSGYVDAQNKQIESPIRIKVETTLNPNMLLSGDFTNVFDG